MRNWTANSACAGQFFAENSVYMFMVSLLSTVNAVKFVDENGKEIYPVPEFAGDLVRFDIRL